MRIEFLTQDDPIYVLPFFEEFLRSYASKFEIKMISCAPTMGNRPRTQLLRELTVLYGAVGVARLLGRTASRLVMSVLPRSGNSRNSYSMKQIAQAYGIPFQKLGNPNTPGFEESVKHRGSDVVISVACPYILKDALLKLPPLGCINIHHAPLPRYKGMMPTFWQMYHGEKSVGVTVHFMATRVDEGRTILQEDLPIEPSESLDHLIRRSKRHGAHCMARALHQVEMNIATPGSTVHCEGSYFTFPTLDEIREFHRRGYRAI